MISTSTESITRKEAKKYLTISIINIILGPILIILSIVLLSLLPAISSIPSNLIFAVGLSLIMWPFIIFLQGTVSLILYFVNHEIMYGMWKKKEKNEDNPNRNIIWGRRIQKIIVIPGVFVMFISFFLLFYFLLS